jgi:hypothetical protein
MATAKKVHVGTDALRGCTVISVDYNEMTLEKDGRTFYVELEEEAYWNTMCDGCCGCGSAPTYMIAFADAVE